VRADKQPFFLAVDHNSIVNVKEMSNRLFGTRNFYANLNEIDLSSHGNLTQISLRGSAEKIVLAQRFVSGSSGVPDADRV
jgi:hypothetical protein